MKENSKYSKNDFLKLLISAADFNSSDDEKAKEYLLSEKLDDDAIVSEGLKRINKLKLKIATEKTKQEMVLAETVKQKANEWVENLLNNIDFSLEELVKEEEMNINFRNVEKLSKEDIKKILVKHFTMKFLNEQENQTNDGL